MTGIIENRYTKYRSQVEISEVESCTDGVTHLVNARELRGGKVWLNTFDSVTHKQTSEMISRFTLVSTELPRAA